MIISVFDTTMMNNRQLLTAEIPTPILTPKLRTSHQMKAPTSPAAPVPEAK